MEETLQYDKSTNSYSRGFSLIELMLVLTILSILLFIAVPNFSGFVSQTRLSGAKDRLISSLSFARTEAIKRGSPSIICRSVDGINCAGNIVIAATRDWAGGWLIFSDENENNLLDNNELMRMETDLNSSLTIEFSRGDLIVFNHLGVLQNAAVNEQTFVLSDAGDNAAVTALSVLATGRIRSCKDWNSGGGSCNDS
ncbi:GspH/FimT family pseudopilin [Amphritea balenae]|uniref:Type II secretion system protein H n=1 Tax=Amphritea balenae TaxID=452629 RepID=A0A3P1SNQ2_9GAMM|nr:GspH/FimT family pseudopilin [Amphritea balenae]RRC98788.1 prepilin-type N-terminal cleavage/methylation domain-containing protein [Amphritea balenae]GGK61700.1 hypothetical protein GCM10007941_09770 [Amphritea balenae]